MNDQPRWPRGTPVAPGGKGPGGGRFRDGGDSAAQILRGFAKELGRGIFKTTGADLAGHPELGGLVSWRLPHGEGWSPVEQISTWEFDGMTSARIQNSAWSISGVVPTQTVLLRPLTEFVVPDSPVVGEPGRGSWVELLSEQLGVVARGWANDDRSRTELHQIARDGEGADYQGEELGGETSTALRVDLPDGRTVVHKTFQYDIEELWDDYDLDEDEIKEAYADIQPEHIDQARAEHNASLVAEAIGALVPPAIQDPRHPSTVWMGWVDGSAGWSWGTSDQEFDRGGMETLDVTSPSGRDAWRLGLLDLLIGNGDRHPGNWLWTDEGRIFGIDHGNAEVFGGGDHTDGVDFPTGPFAELYFEFDDNRDANLVDNALHPDDFPVLRERLIGLRDEGVLLDSELAYMLRVLELLEPHAAGFQRLIP